MKNKLLLFGFAGLILSTSCKKDKDDNSVTREPESTAETFSSLAEYQNSREVPVQSFTMIAENGGTITASNGSVITIPANAFVTYGGASVMGSVTIRMREVFSTSDMIFSEVFPIVNNYFYLNSGGEFYLEAEQNGENLSVAPGQMINVEIPAQAEDPAMELFFAMGDELAIDTAGWQVADSGWSASGFTFNSTNDTYSITLDSMGWCNIDAFINNPTYFDCNFQMTGLSGLDASNTNAYAVFKGENAIWPLSANGWGSITNNTISDNHLAAIDMNVLVISVVGGQLYYGLLDVTPAANQTYSVAMNATTSAELDIIINNLP